MFTGIIECTGKVMDLKQEHGNLDMVIASPISNELKIDQSVSHNGACLTVVEIKNGTHRVIAIDETLRKTNLGRIQVGEEVNLERCMKIGDRLDGHMVQGHVDQAVECLSAEGEHGSWVYQFTYQSSPEHIIVEKGSVCINGISLTAFEVHENTFKVAIIPYTFDHTNIKKVHRGSLVNLEFDVIGKYVARLMEFKNP